MSVSKSVIHWLTDSLTHSLSITKSVMIIYLPTYLRTCLPSRLPAYLSPLIKSFLLTLLLTPHLSPWPQVILKLSPSALATNKDMTPDPTGYRWVTIKVRSVVVWCSVFVLCCVVQYSTVQPFLPGLFCLPTFLPLSALTQYHHHSFALLSYHPSLPPTHLLYLQGGDDSVGAADALVRSVIEHGAKALSK